MDSKNAIAVLLIAVAVGAVAGIAAGLANLPVPLVGVATGVVCGLISSAILHSRT